MCDKLYIRGFNIAKNDKNLVFTVIWYDRA